MRLVAALVAVALWASCAAVAAKEPAGTALVREFVAAWNRHDADAMAGLLADDIVWLTIDGDTVTADIRGTAALREWLAGYWRDLPNSRSRLLSVGPGQRYVQAFECAAWTGKDGAPREQCSASTYEIAGGRIRRVWYFPSEPAPAPP